MSVRLRSAGTQTGPHEVTTDSGSPDLPAERTPRKFVIGVRPESRYKKRLDSIRQRQD